MRALKQGPWGWLVLCLSVCTGAEKPREEAVVGTVLLENAHDVRACGTHDEACRVMIRGALQIHGSVSSGDLEPLLSRVTAVLGPIIVSDTDVLHTLDLPLLSKVKGSLIVRANRALVAINTNVRRSAVEGVVNVLSNTHPIQLLSSLDEGSGVRDRTFDVSTTKRFGSAGAAARALSDKTDADRRHER